MAPLSGPLSLGVHAFVGFTQDAADSDPMKQLQKGYRVAMALAVVGFYIITKIFLNVEDADGRSSSFNFFLCGIVGMAW